MTHQNFYSKRRINLFDVSMMKQNEKVMKPNPPYISAEPLSAVINYITSKQKIESIKEIRIPYISIAYDIDKKKYKATIPIQGQQSNDLTRAIRGILQFVFNAKSDHATFKQSLQETWYSIVFDSNIQLITDTYRSLQPLYVIVEHIKNSKSMIDPIFYIGCDEKPLPPPHSLPAPGMGGLFGNLFKSVVLLPYQYYLYVYIQSKDDDQRYQRYDIKQKNLYKDLENLKKEIPELANILSGNNNITCSNVTHTVSIKPKQPVAHTASSKPKYSVSDTKSSILTVNPCHKISDTNINKNTSCKVETKHTSCPNIILPPQKSKYNSLSSIVSNSRASIICNVWSSRELSNTSTTSIYKEPLTAPITNSASVNNYTNKYHNNTKYTFSAMMLFVMSGIFATLSYYYSNQNFQLSQKRIMTVFCVMSSIFCLTGAVMITYTASSRSYAAHSTCLQNGNISYYNR